MKKIFSLWSKQGQQSPGFVTSLRKIRGSVACDTGSIDESFTQSRYHIRARQLCEIHKAASRGQVDKVQQLLFHKKSGVNHRDTERRTALHLACAKGHLKVVRLLMSRQCEADVVDNEGRTPLMKAVQYQERECAFNLLDYGADPNVADDYGNTALHYAVYNGNMVLITKLLSCGANIEAKNKKQLTPLLLAINVKSLKMVEFLVKNKADINAVDRHERSSLIVAVRSQSEDIVQFLLQQSIDVFYRDVFRLTAKDYAINSGYKAIHQVLSEYMQKSINPENPKNPTENENINPDVISALGSEKQAAGEPSLHLQSFSEDFHDPAGAADPEGESAVNEQGEGSPGEHLPLQTTQPTSELKASVPEKAVRRRKIQSSTSVSSWKPPLVKPIQPAIDMKESVAENSVRKKNIGTSIKGTCSRYFNQADDKLLCSRNPSLVAFPSAGTAGRNHGSGHRAGSPEEHNSLKPIQPAVEMKASVPEKAVRVKNIPTSTSETKSCYVGKAADKLLESRGPTLQTSTSAGIACMSHSSEHRTASPEEHPPLKNPIQPATDIKEFVPQKVVGMKNIQTATSGARSRYVLPDSHKYLDSRDLFPPAFPSAAIADVFQGAVSRPGSGFAAQPRIKWSPYGSLQRQTPEPLHSSCLSLLSFWSYNDILPCLELTPEEKQQRLEGNENNQPQDSQSGKKEKDLLCENRLLQDEIARLRMEVDTIKTQTQEQKLESSEDIETIKYLRNSIKLKRERLAEIISDHSRQLRMLSSENMLLKSELDFEKLEKEKLKTEVQSNLHELSAVLSDLHRSQKSQKDLEFAYQKERDEWSVVKENMTSYSNILFQKLVEAERKFNSLEVELCNTKDILSQKTLALEGVQRDLSQAVCEKKEMELKYHNEQRKMHTYLAEEELAEERLAQLRSRNTELQQQLSHAQDEADNKEKTMMAMQTQFRASVKQLQAESKCQRLLLEARNKELTNKCSHLKEKQKRYKTERAERELQEAQGQRTATMRWPTIDNFMKKLEEENFNLKVIIENQARKMEQLQENLSRARSLQISLLHQLTEARRLAGKMEDHMQMPDIENSQLKARSQKQADRPEQLPHLPSSTGSTQIPALENLEQPRKNQTASRGSEMELSVTEMELSIADAESELSSILASEKLEEYTQVHMKDLQTLKCLSTKVRQLRENLAEVKTHLSGVKQMDRSLHTILTTREATGSNSY
ncbi:ankyrin repeat domain-containing protein 62-like [Nycticebus coucang]|uniref:ankyrin repeat domain-containing protein 62-like n=1 Tax=Nycticebus coucang TaxID=9470 RepID=UPI00234CB1AB|nr:ankyrin repeat domain-containing protein 62-like [Nycticebus coucang]